MANHQVGYDLYEDDGMKDDFGHIGADASSPHPTSSLSEGGATAAGTEAYGDLIGEDFNPSSPTSVSLTTAPTTYTRADSPGTPPRPSPKPVKSSVAHARKEETMDRKSEMEKGAQTDKGKEKEMAESLGQAGVTTATAGASTSKPAGQTISRRVGL